MDYPYRRLFMGIREQLLNVRSAIAAENKKISVIQRKFRTHCATCSAVRIGGTDFRLSSVLSYTDDNNLYYRYRLTSAKNTVLVKIDIAHGTTKVCALSGKRTKSHTITFKHVIDKTVLKYGFPAWQQVFDNTVLSACAIVNREKGVYNYTLLNRIFCALNFVNDMDGYNYNGMNLMRLARRLYKSCYTLCNDDIYNVVNPLLLLLSKHKGYTMHLCYQLKGFFVLCQTALRQRKKLPEEPTELELLTGLYDSFIDRLQRDDMRLKTCDIDTAGAGPEDNYSYELADDLLIDCAFYVHRLGHDKKYLSAYLTGKTSRLLKAYCMQMYLDMGISYTLPTAKTYQSICAYAYGRFYA